MQIIKYCMLFCVFILSSLIGNYIAKGYTYRVQELEEMKNALNIFKTKIKFTYAPIPEIFEEIAKNSTENISKLFLYAKEKLRDNTANIAWEEAVENTKNNLKEEDKQTLKTLSKLLGMTDTEGQISQIEITESFLEQQIKIAQEEKNKNERLYRKLGTTIGLAIVIVLI